MGDGTDIDYSEIERKVADNYYGLSGKKILMDIGTYGEIMIPAIESVPAFSKDKEMLRNRNGRMYYIEGEQVKSILGVDVSVHQGDINWDKTLVFKNDGRFPLGREELTNYGGLPVWVRPKDERSTEYCALVDDVHYSLVSLRHGSVPFDDIEGTVWVEPSYHRDDILTRDEAESASRVFVLPIRAGYDVKRVFSGWYIFDKDRQMFVGEDCGWAFHAEQYGIKYIGFKGAKPIY